MAGPESLPKSPVTGRPNVRSVEEFSAAHIVELYKLQENIDVGRYFPHGDKVYLMECLDTGYRFFYPFEIAGDERFYRELQAAQEEKGLEYDQERADDHQIAFDQIDADEKVLEIGCNTGKFLVKIAEKTSNTLGLEFNSTAAQKARDKGIEVTGASIEEHAKDNPEKYDVVCAFQVLEHIPAIRSFLTSAIAALKPNGKLLLSVPNNEPYFQRFSKYEVLNLPPHHVGLWNLGSLKKLCDFYEIEMTGHKPTSPSPLVVDAWLRAKLLTGIKSLPRRHTIPEKLMIYSAGPFALLRSSLDYIGDNPNHAFISVSYRKKAKDQVSR
jgi:SAM-dependent methyltransferase